MDQVRKKFIYRSVLWALCTALIAPLAWSAQVSHFSPTGVVKGVRQVVARFSEPMVSFGQAKAGAPFEITCPAPGRGRWSDSRVWIYDFDADLPAGVQCHFRTRAGLHTLDGAEVDAGMFEFNTGGPAVQASVPSNGAHHIDENQAFVLILDAMPTVQSVRQNAYCATEGVSERLPLSVVEGEARKEIIASAYKRARYLFTRNHIDINNEKDSARLWVVRCDRALPPEANVQLVWDKGIASPSGLATTSVQALSFHVRPQFKVTQTCTRVSTQAGCVPVLPIYVRFSAPVARALAERVELHSATSAQAPGRTVRPKLSAGAQRVEYIKFVGPFLPNSEVQIHLPPGLVDDAERTAVNAAQFPLKVRIGEAPPLLQFAAQFGIVEAGEAPAMPLTVRGVESLLKGQHVRAPFGAQPPPAPSLEAGRAVRIDGRDTRVLAAWLKRVFSGPEALAAAKHPSGSYPKTGSLPLLSKSERAQSKPINLPAGVGQGETVVIGIPLPQKGLHIVEFASRRLGASLLESNQPYYVYSAALVTDLAVHFKHGRESSLAWVTRLANAQPVGGAAVTVADCTGKILWEGVTDAQGIAHIEQTLPEKNRYEECPHASDAYLVTAHTDDDNTFMLTSWNEGIRPWQFNLGIGTWRGDPLMGHTVTDRALFRAGETVSMKHFVRTRTPQGFQFPDKKDWPKQAALVHEGSQQRFDVPIQWHAHAGVSTWAIPKEAKLGRYQIQLRNGDKVLRSGQFSVEEFRIPLMRAVLKPPAQPQVRAQTIAIDAQLAYLNGGPAAAAPVTFRARVVPHAFHFVAYKEYQFGGEAPVLGIQADHAAAPEEAGGASNAKMTVLATQQRTLDEQGGARLHFEALPQSSSAQALEVEMEYADPSGERRTAATRALLVPSKLVLGIKPEGYFATRKRLSFKVLALDLAGRIQSGQQVRVDAYASTRYAYRKRLLGGFYAYEQGTEVRALGKLCAGRTDARGMLSCDGPAPESGELILVAHAEDAQSNEALASASVYVAGDDDWFAAGASDRIDLLPEKQDYAPGETARFEVRMPFRQATALVSVEREGILNARVLTLDARSPYIEVPIKANYGPNVVVSALVVRGRVGESDATPITGMVDLAKPAFRLGLANVRVGWQAYTLKVEVAPERTHYAVRDKAAVRIRVTDASGTPAAGAHIALAAVDEGLLQLAPNTSWDLLAAMMQTRPLEVETATAQSQVVGKRHFGKKAAAPGGGGGQAGSTRELFDSLLLWRPDIELDAQGQALVHVPLNDSLTSFHIEAIAHQGADRFGHGSASIASTQDVMLLAGLPPVVRAGDRFDGLVTVRNGSNRELSLNIEAKVHAKRQAESVEEAVAVHPVKQRLRLAAGQAQTLSFSVRVPQGAQTLSWQIHAQEQKARAQDTLKITQTVGELYPVRVWQQTLLQLAPEQTESMPVQRPQDSVPARGGIEVRLSHSLAGDTSAIREWMHRYPYSCMEQQASKAIALEDPAAWQALMKRLPAYLDGDGLVKYFPSARLDGDEVLTATLLAMAHQSGWSLPDDARGRMIDGLKAYIAGRINRYSVLQTTDLALRKLTVIEALARYGAAQPQMLESIEIAPNLWPTSALLDWWSILTRVSGVPKRDERLDDVRKIVRARLMYSGTTMNFSSESGDYLWWLMASPDLNAVKLLALASADKQFNEDIGRIARGALGRQKRGRWLGTQANAWGVLALRTYQAHHEQAPVTGQTQLSVLGQTAQAQWPKADDAQDQPHVFAWPQDAPDAKLVLKHEGNGKPWAFVSAKVAQPITSDFFAGYRIERRIEPVAQKESGRWHVGDVARVVLEIEAQSDMTWVVVDDPIAAGSTILGSGLGGAPTQLGTAAGGDDQPWAAFVERRFEGYRAYFPYFPKGKNRVSYVVRLNNAGTFNLPASHVEAMYAPEVFGTIPVPTMEVLP